MRIALSLKKPSAPVLIFIYLTLLQATIFYSFYFFRDIFLWDENDLANLAETGMHIRQAFFQKFLDIFGSSRQLHLNAFIFVKSLSGTLLFELLKKLKIEKLGAIFVSSALVLPPQFPYHQLPFLFSSFALNLFLILGSIYLSIKGLESNKKQCLIINAIVFIITFIANIFVFPIYLPLEILRLWSCYKYSKIAGIKAKRKLALTTMAPLAGIAAALTYMIKNPINSHDYSLFDIIIKKANSIHADAFQTIYRDILELLNEIHKHLLSGWLHSYTSHLTSIHVSDIVVVYPKLLVKISCVILLYSLITTLINSPENSNRGLDRTESNNKNKLAFNTTKEDIIDIIWMVIIIASFSAISVLTGRPFGFYPDPGYSRYAYMAIIPSSIIIYIILKNILKKNYTRISLLTTICLFSISIIASNYYAYFQINDLYAISMEKYARFGYVNRPLWYLPPTLSKSSSLDYNNVYASKHRTMSSKINKE